MPPRLAPLVTAAILASACHEQPDSRAMAITGPSRSAPARLAFLSQPGTAAADAPITPAVRVAVLDSTGSLSIAARHSVSLALRADFMRDPEHLLLGTRTVSAVNGIATFSAISVDYASGGYWLVASAPGLESATSARFTVVPGAASEARIIDQPDSGVAGITLAPLRVELTDGRTLAAGATDVVTIVLWSNPNGATLSGTTTKAAVDGVVTFADLSIDKPGQYVLAAGSNTIVGRPGPRLTILAP
jgi:hypothetical protein